LKFEILKILLTTFCIILVDVFGQLEVPISREIVIWIHLTAFHFIVVFCLLDFAPVLRLKTPNALFYLFVLLSLFYIDMRGAL